METRSSHHMSAARVWHVDWTAVRRSTALLTASLGCCVWWTLLKTICWDPKICSGRIVGSARWRTARCVLSAVVSFFLTYRLLFFLLLFFFFLLPSPSLFVSVACCRECWADLQVCCVCERRLLQPIKGPKNAPEIWNCIDTIYTIKDGSCFNTAIAFTNCAQKPIKVLISMCFWFPTDRSFFIFHEGAGTEPHIWNVRLVTSTFDFFQTQLSACCWQRFPVCFRARLWPTGPPAPSHPAVWWRWHSNRPLSGVHDVDPNNSCYNGAENSYFFICSSALQGVRVSCMSVQTVQTGSCLESCKYALKYLQCYKDRAAVFSMKGFWH